MAFIFQANGKLSEQEQANQQKEMQEIKLRLRNARDAVSSAQSQLSTGKGEKARALKVLASALERFENSFETKYAGKSNKDLVSAINEEAGNGKKSADIATNVAGTVIMIAEGSKNVDFSDPAIFKFLDLSQDSNTFFSFQKNGKINTGSLLPHSGDRENFSFANFYLENTGSNGKEKKSTEPVIVQNYSAIGNLKAQGLTENEMLNMGSPLPYKILYETGNSAIAGKRLAVLANNVAVADQINVVNSSLSMYNGNEEKNSKAKNTILKEAATYSAMHGMHDLQFLFSALLDGKTKQEKDALLSANLLNGFNRELDPIYKKIDEITLLRQAEKFKQDIKTGAFYEISEMQKNKRFLPSANFESLLKKKEAELANIIANAKRLGIAKAEFPKLYKTIGNFSSFFKSLVSGKSA